MKRILIFLMIIMGTASLSAQTSGTILVPDNYVPPHKLEPSSFQKGIDTSTDIIGVAMPLSALIGSAVAGDWEGMKEFAFTAILAGGANIMLKYTVRELRPDHSNYNSFPSLHSTVAFGSAAFLQRRYGWKIGGPAYALATYVAAGRVIAKKHHWWDCVVGAAIGAGSAYIFTKPWAKKHDFSMVPVANDEYVGLASQISF
ncbi:MAG: phosphatase PAP2 family protein [Muribaculaceae bacterium]|nr:phosphatase PAP2 family protein [Muribaculaceae bacterium]